MSGRAKRPSKPSSGGPREHFVPQFYLRKFESRPGFIHALDVETGNVSERPISRVPYSRDIYGTKVESWLSRIEQDMAEHLDRASQIGVHGPGCGLLWLFAILQDIRRPELCQDLMQSFDMIMNYMPPGTMEAERKALGEIRKDRNGMPFLLGRVASVLYRRPGLPCRIVHVGRHTVVTSDAPVVRTNPYRSLDRSGMAVNGWGASGLQVVLPISDSTVVIFYDDKRYRPIEPLAKNAAVPVASVVMTMQLLNADRWVYFSDKRMEDTLLQCAEEVRETRQQIRETGMVRRLITTDGNPVFHVRGQDMSSRAPWLVPVLRPITAFEKLRQSLEDTLRAAVRRAEGSRFAGAGRVRRRPPPGPDAEGSRRSRFRDFRPRG